MLPAVGAVAGAVLFYVAVDDECANGGDCMVHIPPHVTGAVLGGAVGLVFEIAL